jgi:hypothetical protein
MVLTGWARRAGQKRENVFLGAASRRLLSGGGRRGGGGRSGGVGSDFHKNKKLIYNNQIAKKLIEQIGTATRKTTATLSRHELQTSTTSTWQQPCAKHLKHRGIVCLSEIMGSLEASALKDIKPLTLGAQPTVCTPWQRRSIDPTFHCD